MNLVYISCLTGKLKSGPTYSVPNQILAQSKFDNVFWYNISYNKIDIFKNYEFYHDLIDFPSGKIEYLPIPFNKPDLIIVEQFYDIIYSYKILLELTFGNIPFIFIPRGELTLEAQKHHHFRKFIFNNLIYKRFSKKAKAIQFLTYNERDSSRNDWNKNSFIIPNGISIPNNIKDWIFCNNNSIHLIAIGRLDSNHKGYDLLIKACSLIKDELLSNNCHIDIYGYDDGDKLYLIKLIDIYKQNKLISIKDGIYGKDKEEKLLNSDVFLMTSRYEGHPMGLLEALAHGLPCLVTTGSNMREEIENYGCGWGADNNVESIKNALLSVLKDKNNFKIKGENARKLAEKYSWEKIASISHEKYLELLSR